MPSKYAATSNIRYDENMRYDVTCASKASEGLPSLIASFSVWSSRLYRTLPMFVFVLVIRCHKYTDCSDGFWYLCVICRRHVPVDSIVSPIDEDPDVANERRRVLRGAGRNDILRLENLTKVRQYFVVFRINEYGVI